MDDSRVEGTQVSQVRHSASSADATYNGMPIAAVSATVLDNDNASPSALTLTEGARSSYLFALNRAPAATVVISMTNSGGLQLSPATLTFTPASWNIPQTVVARAIDDGLAQGDRTANIQHRAISADASYSGVQLAPVAAKIRDNDGPAPTIAVNTTADTLAADGACSLREAIEAANTNASVFDCAASPASYHVINLANATYSLARQNDPAFPYDASLIVKSTLMINGNGATESAITVDAGLGGPAGAPAAYGLLAGSPAIDRVAPIDCTYASGAANPLFLDDQPIAGDQLGAVRPRGLRCDSGATELAQPGIGLTVTALEVPTGRFGSVYQVVLNTQPTSDVTIELASTGGVIVAPSRLVFTPLNWNVPQTVTVLARPGAGLAGRVRLAGAAIGTVTHRVSSADPAYAGESLASVAATVLVVPTNGAGASVFIPLAQR